MSWFTDLAGKAEELLNKVDQSAAVALKKDEVVSGATSILRNDPQMFAIRRDNVVVPPPPLSSSAFLSHEKPVRPLAVLQTPASKTKSTTKDDDEEKLFEFLNSPETSVASNRQTASGINSRRTTSDRQNDTQLTVKEDNESAREELPKEELANDGRPRSSEVISVPDTPPPPPPPPILSSLEMENRLLRNEVASLNQELHQSLQKTQSVESEFRGVQKQLDRMTTQLSAEEGRVRELQYRQADLQQAIEAKDSQLAILRVRFEEADEESKAKRETVEKLEAENRRIVDDHSSSSGLQTQTLQAMQNRLRQAEEQLEREEEQFRNMQNELQQRIAHLEEELRSATDGYAETKRKWQEEKSRHVELAGQLRTTKSVLETCQQELADYKTKAQRILQSKERLISSLKESTGGGTAEANVDGVVVATAVELEELRQERDQVKDDLLEATRQMTVLRSELNECESQLQQELESARECSGEMEERLREERARRDDVEQEASQLKDEVKYLREDGTRQKVALQSRVNDRDAEIERLRKQLMAKQVNSSGPNELEARLNALTESLIQKQTVLEALSSEKSALVFQLERAEQRLKEQSRHSSSRSSSMAVSLSDDGDVKLRVPAFMTETPLDGQVARKVKRVYNSIDMLSFRLGVFLRRYPVARIFIIVYMLLLHFWVILVLLTYSPEIHDKECSAPKGNR